MSGINHIGITVTDIDAAMNWYVNTFGLRVLADSPIHCDTTTEGADRRADVFGQRVDDLREFSSRDMPL